MVSSEPEEVDQLDEGLNHHYPNEYDNEAGEAEREASRDGEQLHAL